MFLKLLPTDHLTLQAMTGPNQFEGLGIDRNWEWETVTKPRRFLCQIQSSSFLISLEILLEV